MACHAQPHLQPCCCPCQLSVLTDGNSVISLSEEDKPAGEVLYVSAEPLTQLDFLPAFFKEDKVDRLLAGSG